MLNLVELPLPKGHGILLLKTIKNNKKIKVTIINRNI